MVALLDALRIPFVDETKLTPILLSDGRKYPVDYLIYPGDPVLEAYLEVKPFRPTDVEISKAGDLHRATGIVVFILWGEHFVPGLGLHSDKWTEGGQMVGTGYQSGLRAAKIFTNSDGDLDYEDGYYFMANDRAGGEEWEEVTETASPRAPNVYRNRALERYLERGGRYVGPNKRRRFEMRPTVREASRVVTTSGRRFRAVDVFKPYLYRFRPFATNKPSSHVVPGPSDWNSDIMQRAYKAAREA